eukprot:snap_masked-scaffold19_size710362-processed-gene-4.9 protein:Tk00402 transcript:snap_masked-scaffold19_size710362-processed-gene-4.9-mRNA-1 annotation:"PREDICTED: uncharacterized protein LOC100900865"
MIQNCPDCSRLLPSQQKEPLVQTQAQRPFESVSVDLFELKGQHYLVMVDRYSLWTCVQNVRKLDTATIVQCLDRWFIDYGLPDRIRTDGGPQFRGPFKEYCSSMAVDHELSSPYNHQSNGHAESAVKSMKHLVTKSGSWPKFQLALREWRNTPTSKGLSPAQLLFNRRQRTLAPAHPENYEIIETPEREREEERSRLQSSRAKRRYDLRTKNLPRLPLDATVIIQNPLTKRWDSKDRNVGNLSHIYLSCVDGKRVSGLV